MLNPLKDLSSLSFTFLGYCLPPHCKTPGRSYGDTLFSSPLRSLLQSLHSIIWYIHLRCSKNESLYLGDFPRLDSLRWYTEPKKFIVNQQINDYIILSGSYSRLSGKSFPVLLGSSSSTTVLWLTNFTSTSLHQITLTKLSSRSVLNDYTLFYSSVPTKICKQDLFTLFFSSKRLYSFWPYSSGTLL